MKKEIYRLFFNLALVASAVSLVVLSGCSGVALQQGHCDTINGQARPVGCK